MDEVDNTQPVNEGGSLDEFEALQLLERLRDRSKEDEFIRTNGRIVESLMNCLGPEAYSREFQFARSFGDPEVPMQILANLIKTWATLMTKGRPSVMAVPTATGLEQVQAAKIATKFIEYFQKEENTAEKWHESALFAAEHGTGLMKIAFDSMSQKVVWEPLSIYSVFLQNARNRAGVKWALVRTYIDQYDAKDLIMANKPDYAGMPAETEYNDALGITRKGVEKWEVYVLPGGQGLAKGAYYCVIDGNVIELMDYPYVFPEKDGEPEKAYLPIVWWTCSTNREGTLGTSWSWQAMYLQANLNAIFSKISKDALQARQMLLLPSGLKNSDMIDYENLRIYFDTSKGGDEAAKQIRWVSPEGVDPQLNSQMSRLVDSLYLTSGISQQTTGNANASQSGTALAYQSQLDADKFADAFKSLEVAQKDAYILTLKLAQKYLPESWQFAVAGEDPISFDLADIAGLTIQLVPRSETDSLPSEKLKAAKEDIGNGFAGREALLDTAPSAQTEGMSLIANDIITEYLETGNTPDFDPSDMPSEIFLRQVEKFLTSAQLHGDQEAVDSLEFLRKAYLKHLVGYQKAQADQSGVPNEQPSPAPLPQEDIADEQLPKKVK